MLIYAVGISATNVEIASHLRKGVRVVHFS
jgi:hypothetical protein